MKSFIGVCYVGVSIGDSHYALLRFAKDRSNGISFLYPPVISIAREEMLKIGLSITLEALRNMEILDANSTPNIPRNEWQRLKRTHRLVEIALLKSINGQEEIEFKPLHTKRGGRFDVEPDETMKFQLPITKELFFTKLSQVSESST